MDDRPARTSPHDTADTTPVRLSGRAAAGAPTAARRRRPLDLRVTLLGVAGFLVAISWQVVLPVLPLHLARIGYTPAQIGTLVSLLSLAMGVVELEVGRIAGTLGQRWTLIGGLLANTVGLVWIAVVRAAEGIAGGLMAVGAARATMWSPLHAAVAAAASEETRGRAFGVFWFLTSVAFLAGPAIGGVVAAAFGDRAVFYLGGAVSLLTLILIVVITEPGRPTLRVTATGAREVLKDPVIFRLCLVNHLYYAMTGIWSTFIPLYVAHQGFSVLTVGWVFTIQGFTYALVQLPTGRLADRIGPERLILPGVIGRGVLALLVPLFHTPGMFLLAGAAYGFVGGLMPVTLTTLVARFSPKEQYTSAMGVYNSSGDLGFFLGPFLGGGAALLGLLAPFFLCGPLVIVATAVGLGSMAAVRRSQGEL